ncbi:hypothetical protein COV27_01015, partial [candidate division WWE3 bacterium CG10_big_fil_rev_8_21_14_0_10_39_14]
PGPLLLAFSWKAYFFKCAGFLQARIISPHSSFPNRVVPLLGHTEQGVCPGALPINQKIGINLGFETATTLTQEPFSFFLLRAGPSKRN